jgi:hypothetical protein
MYVVDSGIEEIVKVRKLNKIELYLSGALIVIEALMSELSIPWALVLLISIFLIYKYKEQTISELRYTYWGLIFFQFNILLICIGNSETSVTTLLSFITFFVMAMESYIMMSPIFFPRIKWWEYDFRYRGDIKVKINIDDHTYDARLLDLRRNAAVITLFENIDFNRDVSIHIKFMNELLEFKAKIISKRESNLGRGITYGVSFLYDSAEERQKLNRFKKFWSMNNSIRLRHKFRRK